MQLQIRSNTLQTALDLSMTLPPTDQHPKKTHIHLFKLPGLTRTVCFVSCLFVWRAPSFYHIFFLAHRTAHLIHCDLVCCSGILVEVGAWGGVFLIVTKDCSYTGQYGCTMGRTQQKKVNVHAILIVKKAFLYIWILLFLFFTFEMYKFFFLPIFEC